MDIEISHLVILILGVYRLTRLIIEDTITEPIRNWIWDRWGYEKGVGYLVTCYWCTSFWVASLTVILYTIVPIPTTAIMLVLALSAGAGLIAARIDQ